MINRKKGASVNKTWSPSKNAIVCSEHFVDKMPTEANPLPTLNLGYQVHREPTKGRQNNAIEHQKASEAVILISPQKSCQDDTEDWTALQETAAENRVKNTFATTTTENESTTISAALKQQLAKANAENFKQSMTLRAANKRLLQLTGPLHKTLLKTDKDVLFYAGIPTKRVYYSLCKAVRKLSHIQIKPSQNVTMRLRQKYKMLPSNTQRALHYNKLSLADQILLTLMKLRLGLLHKDLADRYVFNNLFIQQ